MIETCSIQIIILEGVKPSCCVTGLQLQTCTQVVNVPCKISRDISRHCHVHVVTIVSTIWIVIDLDVQSSCIEPPYVQPKAHWGLAQHGMYLGLLFSIHLYVSLISRNTDGPLGLPAHTCPAASHAPG